MSNYLPVAPSSGLLEPEGPFEAFRAALFRDQDELTSSEFRWRMDEALNRHADRLFEHVSRPAKRNSAFEEAFAEAWAPTKNPTALHLELGTSKAWPERYTSAFVREQGIADVIRFDLDPACDVDVVGDAMSLPFRSESVDRVSSNSLLEHVLHPHKVIAEAFRVLKPGGVFYSAAPFHFVEHSCPKDYLRFTSTYFEEVCQEVGFIGVETDAQSTSGVFYTIHNLLKASLPAPDLPTATRQIVETAHRDALKLLAALQAFDGLMAHAGASHWHTSRVVARKPGNYVPNSAGVDRRLPPVDRYAGLLCAPGSLATLTRSDQGFLSACGRTFAIDSGVPILSSRSRTVA